MIKINKKNTWVILHIANYEEFYKKSKMEEYLQKKYSE